MLHRKLILFSTGNRYTLQLVKLNDVFLTQDVSESVLCASRNLTQRNKKITLVVQKKIVKVVGGVFAVNMHCVFLSIVIIMQINFIETLDLQIYQ